MELKEEKPDENGDSQGESNMVNEEDDESSEDEGPLTCYIDESLIDKVVELIKDDVERMLYLKEYKEKSI